MIQSLLEPSKEVADAPMPKSMIFEVVGEAGAQIRESVGLDSDIVTVQESGKEPEPVILPKGTLVQAFNLRKAESNAPDSQYLNRRVYIQQVHPDAKHRFLYLPPYSFNINTNIKQMAKGWASIVSSEGYLILSQVDISKDARIKPVLSPDKSIRAKKELKKVADGMVAVSHMKRSVLFDTIESKTRQPHVIDSDFDEEGDEKRSE
jgi:hypothetical protein